MKRNAQLRGATRHLRGLFFILTHSNLPTNHQIGDKIKASNEKIAQAFEDLGDKIEEKAHKLGDTIKSPAGAREDASKASAAASPTTPTSASSSMGPGSPMVPGPMPLGEAGADTKEMRFEGGLARMPTLDVMYSHTAETKSKMDKAVGSTAAGITYWAREIAPHKKAVTILWAALVVWMIWDAAENIATLGRIGYRAGHWVWGRLHHAA